MRWALVLMTVLWLAGCCTPPAVAQAGMRSVDQVRSSAGSALSRIGAPAMPALIAALEDQADEVRSKAADELG